MDHFARKLVNCRVLANERRTKCCLRALVEGRDSAQRETIIEKRFQIGFAESG